MYENYKKKEDELPFIPALFKERFLTDLKAEFSDLAPYLPDLSLAADCFIKTLSAKVCSYHRWSQRTFIGLV